MKPLLAAVATVAMLTQAAAHQVCGAHKDIIEGLGQQYGETVGFQAVTDKGEFLELLVADKTGSFTMIATRPGGQTCIVDSGQGNFKQRWDFSPSLDH